jgi:sporulation protein YlmC with PRC-barrel domain
LTNATNNSLRKLRDTDLASINYVDDVRGTRVVDSAGEPVGLVETLFVDGQQRKVRFLRVEPDRGFNTGGGTILIPVDAITNIARGVVRIDRPRAQVAIAPRDLSLLSAKEDVEMLYRYYGLQPFWAAGYEYPRYPFYV